MIALILAALLAVQGTQASGDEEFVVPTEICRGFWMIPVTLEARDSDAEPRTLWFLHDTGASRTVVDPDSIERVSGQRVAEGRRVNIRDASAGRVQFNRLPAEVRDLDHLSYALGREIDGIMSVGALDDFLMILDYPAGEMRLRRGGLPRPDGVTVFSSRGPDSRPWLRVDFAGREQRLLIDSGAALLGFAVNDIDDFDLRTPPRLVTGAVRFDRLEPRRLARLDGDADVAGLRFQSPVLEEVPRSPLLGGEALRNFVVTLDQQNRRVQLERATDGPMPAEDHFEFGAVMRPTSAGFEIVRLFKDTPLSAAGAETGDVITHFGDTPAIERGCDFQVEGERLDLQVLRDGERLVLDLPLTPVFPAPG